MNADLLRDIQNKLRRMYGECEYPLLSRIQLYQGYWWAQIYDTHMSWVRITDLLSKPYV
jgi:hypothetical protein